MGQQILLIEPDTVLAETYAKALGSLGKVSKAATAQEALLIADRDLPDLVICELQLVSHSGIEFLYEFRSYRDWQEVPVIVLSSVPPIEFIGSQEGLSKELGINKYLYKPHTSLRTLIRAATETMPHFSHEPA